MTIAHDVVVIGGGPAGNAAGTLLARCGHDVALVRPSTPPAAGLAESIPPSSGRLMTELGLLNGLEAAGLHPNRGNTVWWAGGGARVERFEAGRAGVHVDRVGLEGVMGELSRSAGVRVYDGSVGNAIEADGQWRLACRAGSGEEITLDTRWVIDATGRRGLLARREGRKVDRRTTTVALVRRWASRDGFPGVDPTHTLVESYHDGWAWSVPLAPDVRCFTAMIDHRNSSLSGRALSRRLDRELAKASRLASMLEGTRPIGVAWACPASLYTTERFARPGLLLAGDAGSFIDPLSSFGVKKALSSGWLAAIALNTALTDGAMADTALRFFDGREGEVYRGYRARSVAYFAACAEAYGHAYWRERAEAARVAADPSSGEPRDSRDPEGRRRPADEVGELAGEEPNVLMEGVPAHDARAALDRIRRRPRLDARRGASLRVVQRPTVRGYKIVHADHLATDRIPTGIRWVRNVDLARVVEVAPLHGDVPGGWEAYNSAAPSVSLPDYLAALATAFAAGLLEGC